ncbi:MAG: LCP family protein [Patescibacteria group bacterium]|jgi:anionic cell wall polymer biosynthesis LytR-Cps2A-Psr (LCP) family protein
MRKKWNPRGSLVIGIVVVLLGIAVITRAVTFMKNIGVRSTGTTQSNTPQTEFNIALLGFGGGNHEGAYLTDTIIVAHIDTAKNKVLMISIPRDLWVQIPTKSKTPYYQKINAVYEMGLFPSDFPDLTPKYAKKDPNGLLLKEILKNITGLRIDNYFAADFSAFTKTIDLLGGIDIVVDTAFVDPVYPIDGKENDLCGKDEQFKKIEPYLTQPDQAAMDALFKDNNELKEFFINITDAPEKAFPCRYETLEFAKGAVHLTGAEALKFVRSRHSLQDGSDFGRAARQQKVIIAIKNKVLSIGFIPRILPLIKELEGHIVTDLSYDEIGKSVTEVKDASSYKVNKLVLSDKNYLTNDFASTGQFILRPKAGDQVWTTIHREINNTILDITPTPSVSPKISNGISSQKLKK